MTHKIQITPNKTYATADNAVKAVEKAFSPEDQINFGLRYFVMQNESGRFFPVFVGQSALDRGVHFGGWNIIG